MGVQDEYKYLPLRDPKHRQVGVPQVGLGIVLLPGVVREVRSIAAFTRRGHRRR